MTQPKVSIFDLGTAYTRCGFAGDDQPRATCVTACGRVRSSKSQLDQSRLYFADDLESKRQLMRIQYPVEKGKVVHWDETQNLFKYLYSQELRIDPSECVAFVTEQFGCDRQSRAKMCELMTEKYLVKGFYQSLAQQNAILASGMTTGVVVDVGEGQSSIVPVFEGVQLPHAVRQGEFAGKELTQELYKQIREIDTNFQQDPWILREIKQQISLQDGDLSYELPDGQKILKLKNTNEIPQLMFNGQTPLQFLIQESIKSCDPDLQSILSENVCLSGGSTQFGGFHEKLEDELTKSQLSKCKLNPLEDRHNATFVGCSILASLDQFKDFYVSAQEVQDLGADVISMKWL